MRDLLEDPNHYGEVALTRDSPRRLGLRLFFEDLSEVVKRLELPQQLLQLADELQSRFDLVPGHWLRLGLEQGQACRFALNYEVPPQNRYPISTLRVFLRRYGASPPQHLERALQPALELQQSRWGLTLELTREGPRPRIFARIPRHLVEIVGGQLAGPDFQSLWEEISAFPDSQWCYLSFVPAHPELLSVDLEEIPLSSLALPLKQWPDLPEPLLCPYAKFRAGGHTAYLPWPALAAWWLPPTGPREFLGRVRAYYDAQQKAYLDHLGTTWQAGMCGQEGVRQSNLRLAERAGIQAGMRILDAGCGVAGPALDLAQAYEGLRVDGITLCPAQQQEGAARVCAAGLQHRISLQPGDFHHLPFPSDCFDRVLYLESTGYAYDRLRLFEEAYRVLAPGGMLYIKDVFRHTGPLNANQWLDLHRFDRLYAQKTPTLEETSHSLEQAGFKIIECGRIEASMQHYHRAMGSAGQPTEFGRAHGQTFRHLPLYFGEVLALRPATPG